MCACWGQERGAYSSRREAGRSVFPPLSLDTTQKGHFSPVWSSPRLSHGRRLRQPGLGEGQAPWGCPWCLALPCRRSGTGAASASLGPSPSAPGRRTRPLPPPPEPGDGKSQARGAAFVLKPSEDSCVWSFATLFRKMSGRMMTWERWAEGLPFDLGKAQVDPSNWLCRCPARSSQRPGGELLSSPGLFIFSHSQSFASLPLFWLRHHSSVPVTPKAATQPVSLHLRMQLSLFFKQR